MIVEREEVEARSEYFHEVGDLLQRFFMTAPRGSALRARIDVALKATRQNEADSVNLLLRYESAPEGFALAAPGEALN